MLQKSCPIRQIIIALPIVVGNYTIAPTVPSGTVVKYPQIWNGIFLGKVAVFIDGGFFEKVLDGPFGRPKIDFEKFCDNLCDGSDYRLRTYYYDCMPFQSDPPTEDEKRRYANKQRFMNVVERLPRFESRLGKLGWVGGELVQKRVDVLFAVDLVRMSWRGMIEKAVIITGDSDFVPAVQAAKEAGVVVQLYYYRARRLHEPNTHDELLSAVDERYEIDQGLIDKSLRDDKPGRLVFSGGVK
jgi:uncharacterized LabA/DUF88 family protein